MCCIFLVFVVGLLLSETNLFMVVALRRAVAWRVGSSVGCVVEGSLQRRTAVFLLRSVVVSRAKQR